MFFRILQDAPNSVSNQRKDFRFWKILKLQDLTNPTALGVELPLIAAP